MSAGKVTPLRAVRMSAYEATSSSRKLDDWDRVSVGPNAALDHADVARARAQDGTRNNPWLKKALKLLTSHIVGCGIQPRPAIADPALRRQVLDLWNDWTPHADADGAVDFYALQGLITRARIESGECFIRLRPRRASDDLPVPLQLQALEADLLPVDYNRPPNIRQGIERNALGQRVAYHFHREHPGDRSFGAALRDLTRVDAREILHHYVPERPGQLRGAPETQSALIRARKLDQFESAELTRRRNRAKFQGAIYRENPDGNPLTDLEPAVEDGRAMVDIEEGYMLQLALNEKADFYNGDSGGSGVDFLRTHLRAIAAAFGVPYELMTGDYEGTNDRIMRVILNAFYRQLEIDQDGLAHQVLQPLWKAWIEAAALTGRVNLPGYFTDPRPWQRCEWRAHAWTYVNPLQEAQTAILKIDNGLTSRAAAVAETGWDVEDVDRDQAADRERERALGLSYGRAAGSAAAITEAPDTVEKPT